MLAKDIWATTWQNQQSECAPREDSGQPGHPPSLIRDFAVNMKKAWVLTYPLSAQWRLCDHTGRMPRLIRVFAGRTLILLGFSCRGSFMDIGLYHMWNSFMHSMLWHWLFPYPVFAGKKYLNWIMQDLVFPSSQKSPITPHILLQIYNLIYLYNPTLSVCCKVFVVAFFSSSNFWEKSNLVPDTLSQAESG